MTKIVPFKAIRACRDKAHLVATRSYLTYSATTLKEKLNKRHKEYVPLIAAGIKKLDDGDYDAYNSGKANNVFLYPNQNIE